MFQVCPMQTSIFRKIRKNNTHLSHFCTERVVREGEGKMTKAC